LTERRPDGDSPRVPVYTIQPDRAGSEVFTSLRLRLLKELLFLAMVVVAIALGFFVLDVAQDPDGDYSDFWFEAVWNTLNIVSTVGSLTKVSPLERAWGMLAIVVGLVAVLFGFGSLMAMFTGDVAQMLERRKMRRKLHDMKNHIVVCGYGRVGRSVAAELRRQKVPLIVIDVDPQAVNAADEEGYNAIEGDCAEDQTLRAASIEHARGLIAALKTDAANVYLILMARELQPSLRIVSRAELAETRGRVLRAGADRAIAPSDLAAHQLSHLMLKPLVSEFVAAATGEGEFDFAEMEVAEHPQLQNKKLGDLDLAGRAEAIVISVVTESGQHEFNPRPQRVLKSGDTLVLVCREGGLEQIAALT
jgi:voltage-gated potassium channel